MKTWTHVSRSVVTFLFLLSISLPVSAQHFSATRILPDGDVLQAEGHAYTLDLQTLQSYVESEKGTFPLALSFSDTLSWLMDIEAHDLRSPDYKLITSSGEVLLETPAATYKGRLHGDPDSQVRMTIADGFFRAFVKEGDGEAYYLESAPAKADENPVVSMYPGDDDELAGYCASAEEHRITTQRLKSGGSVSPQTRSQQTQNSQAPFETEIAFAVDRLAYAQYASLEELELELLTILNYTDAYYEIHQITYRLTETYVVEDLASQPWNEFSDAGQMLDEFTDWANDAGSLQHHDVATLWTGISFGSTIGIAWINVIGSTHRQNVVNFPNARERRNANVHAHELGHNWGSDHVSSSGWIMSAGLSSPDTEKEWHSTVIDAFPGYLENALSHLDDLNESGGALPVGIDELLITDEINSNQLLDPGETANLNVVIENLEATPIENVLVSMFNDNNRAKNHVAINTEPVLINMLEANSTTTVTFNITLSAEAPTDRSLRFLYEIADADRVVEITASIVSGQESLPVELTAFDALVFEGDVQLNWATASETNNARFEVEYQFEEGVFETMGFVAGAGTTIESQLYSFTVDGLAAGRYGFRLKQVDYDGTFDYSDVVYVDLLPQQHSLQQNYPNPFNPQTHIAFQLPAAREVTLEVFDLLGRRISVLVNGVLEAGDHAVTFNAGDLPNGTYMYRLTAGEFVEMKSMVLLK